MTKHQSGPNCDDQFLATYCIKPQEVIVTFYMHL